MQELGLNPYQYSKLVGIPYEIVKNVIYDSDVGGYNMEIKDFFRNKLFEKHQEIENDYQKAKLEATKIKLDEIRQAQINGDVDKVKELTEKYYDEKYAEIDYLDWYNNVYNVEMLKEATNVPSVRKFERDFYITIKNTRASHWFYTTICSKTEYKGHNINPDVKLEFIKQLYDIVVNGNIEKYRKRKEEELLDKDQKEIIDWYKNYDFKYFREKYQKTNLDIARDLDIAYTTACQITANDYSTFNMIEKVYYYVKKIDSEFKERKKNMNEFDYKEWFKDFDIKKFMETYNLTNEELAKKLNKGYSTICMFTSKTLITKPIAKDFYDYVNGISTTIEETKQENEPSEDYEVEMKKDNIEEIKEMIKEDVEKEEINELTQNDLLRNLLINRLTEEEKTLIRIFGGQI